MAHSGRTNEKCRIREMPPPQYGISCSLVILPAPVDPLALQSTIDPPAQSGLWIFHYVYRTICSRNLSGGLIFVKSFFTKDCNRFDASFLMNRGRICESASCLPLPMRRYFWFQLGFIFLSKASFQSKPSKQSIFKKRRKNKGIAEGADFSTIPEIPLLFLKGRCSTG